LQVIENGQITAVPGISVGHSTNEKGKTGCTTILCAEGAVAGADIRGSAPGTVEIEVLKPIRLVPKIDALYFTGGSALGLASFQGVQNYLIHQGIGYDTGNAKIPIVPGAVIYDIGEEDEMAIPDENMAYASAENAMDGHFQEGLVGAGTGATVANMFGPDHMMRGGLASMAARTPDDVTVGVLVVANPFGGIFDRAASQWLAGQDKFDQTLLYQSPEELWQSNTTLVAIATDASLSKEECIKVSEMSQDGFARAIYPAHTMFDGDLSVTLSVGKRQGNINGIGHTAALLVERCILRAVELGN
jgi:L-aminopeptidase/D-esterase-like protein